MFLDIFTECLYRKYKTYFVTRCNRYPEHSLFRTHFIMGDWGGGDGTPSLLQCSFPGYVKKVYKLWAETQFKGREVKMRLKPEQSVVRV